MDPILRIIHYLFEKRGQEIKDNTFNSFFSNGISFPKFIENIFNQKVPGIIENPSNETEAISNNQNALNFLFSKNNYIANKSPNFNSEKEQVELLTLILTKQCFEIDREQIRNKCNDLIYDNSGPYFATESDCFHENFFLYLLNALTKNEVTTCTDLPDFDSILISKFREAKCPLVIDKTALKPERSFTFYIQILIMFDFFSKKENNTDEKQQNNEKQTNNEEQQNTFENILDNEYIDADDENENDFNGNSLDEVSNNNDLYKSLLLQTINKLNKCNFISLKESVEKDNIIVFAGKIMKDKKDNSFIKSLIKEKTKTNDTKIKEFLKFLGEKEPIFNILSMKLNFKDDDLKENTAVLFYTKFLDYFFIKTSKQELFERCKTLLFTIKMRESDAMYKNVKYIKNQNILKVLKDFNLYMALIYFIGSSKLHYSFSVVETLNNYTFQNQSVPQLFDEKQLSKCEHIISPMYYQLQLLFNKLDDKYKFKHLFIESITKCIRKLIKIRMPDIKNLASTIIMKNTALIEQHKRFKEYCKIDTTLIKKQFHDYEEKQSTNSKEQTNADSTIDSDLMKTMRGGSKGSLSSETDFWNFNDNEYKYIDLLFTNNENINEQIWKNAIIDEQNKVINVISYDKPEYVFDSIKPQKNNHPLYKFFIYNEREQKWEKNKDGIDSFKKNLEKLIPKNQIPGNKLPKNAIPKTPLVLFFNSNETDLITLNSNLIQSQYPNIYDDEIFVYALCDKPLAFLNYIIDMRNFQSNQKPIFLLLHIPEEKLKLKNIKIIIYQIYYFLSFICDIAVTVLNKKDFIDQLTLVENLSTIKSKYNIEKNQMSTRNLSPRKMINDDDDNFSSDDDEINENEENEYIIDKNNDKINKELLYQLIKKKTEFIVLINNDVINANFATQTNCDFIKDIEEQFKNIHLYMININRTITYNSFLTVLTQLASNYLIEYNEVFERFDMFQMTNVYGSYVVFRLENSWSNYLKEMIEKRFMQYKDHNDKNLSNYDLLNKLHDEIACTFPLFDEEYSTFCNKIITDILTKKSKKHMDIFNMELEKCSSIELLRLNNIIAKKKYLSEADKENIQKSHENFLKTKYFDILNHFFEKNELHIFFHHNYSILEQKIKQDRENINEKFKVNKQKNCTDSDEQKYTNINEQKQVGTYYTFREKESYKEKTVIVKSKDFENDFGDDKE